jgi:hypothetical protein
MIEGGLLSRTSVEFTATTSKSVPNRCQISQRTCLSTLDPSFFTQAPLDQLQDQVPA